MTHGDAAAAFHARRAPPRFFLLLAFGPQYQNSAARGYSTLPLQAPGRAGLSVTRATVSAGVGSPSVGGIGLRVGNGWVIGGGGGPFRARTLAVSGPASMLDGV